MNEDVEFALRYLNQHYKVRIRYRVLTGRPPYNEKYYEVTVSKKGEMLENTDLWHFNVGDTSAANAILTAYDNLL